MASIRSSLKAVYMAGVLIALNALSTTVMAFTAPPDVNSFGYTAYDWIVVKILQGPIGFVGGVFAIVWAGMHLTKSWVVAFLAAAGGTIALKADKIVVAIGAIF